MLREINLQRNKPPVKYEIHFEFSVSYFADRREVYFNCISFYLK